MIILNILVIICFTQINQPISAEFIVEPIESLSFDWEFPLIEGEGHLDVILDTITDNNRSNIYVVGFITQHNIGKSFLLKLSRRGELLWRNYSSYTFSQPHITFCDINFDRLTDIIVSDERIIVYNGGTGDIISESPVNVRGYTPAMKCTDINGDKQKELILAECTGSVKLIDIYQSKVLWERKVVTQRELISFGLSDLLWLSPPPVIYDINNDKRYEIFISFGLPCLFCLDAKTGKTIWKYNSNDVNFVTSPLIFDCDEDSRFEVIVATQGWYGDINLSAFDAVEGTIVWATKFFGEFSGGQTINYFKFGDIPLFMITVKCENKVYFVDSKNGLILDEFKLPFLIENSSVYDIDGDGLSEAIFISHDSHFNGKLHNLYVYDIIPTKSSNFETEIKSLNDISFDPTWRWSYNSRPPILEPRWYLASDEEYRFQNVYDIDGDGLVEVIMLSARHIQDKKLRVLKIIPPKK